MNLATEAAIEKLGGWTEDDYVAHGAAMGLPAIDAHFMPEFKTRRDPVTENEIREAHVIDNGRTLSRGLVRTREKIQDGSVDYAMDDKRLRASMWYWAAALREADAAFSREEPLDRTIAYFLHRHSAGE